MPDRSVDGLHSLGRRFPLLDRFLEWAEVDYAIIFALLSKSWQVLAAPVTILLVVTYLSPEMQGFYYTFYSLLALQAFVELGLFTVIVAVASHEWADLELDASGVVVGRSDALSRLVSLGRFAFKWYALASALLMLGVGVAGYVFFSGEGNADVVWRAPWVVFIVVSALVLWTLPFVSLLEGCNQVATVNRFRVSQVILGSLALWITLVLGGGLWAAVAAASTSLIRDLYLLLVQYRGFFRPFFSPPTSRVVDWKSEVWPMQWRLAVSGVATYFSAYLYAPVIFHYYGPVAAGQIGMTWTLIINLGSISWAWMATKVPRFGVLIQKKDYQTLDRSFYVTTGVTTVLMIVGALGLWGIVFILDWTGYPLSDRLLGPLPTALLSAGAILLHITRCQSSYLRAHKIDPLVVFSVASNGLIGVLVWVWGSRYGPMGAVLAFLVVQAIFVGPWTLVWQKYRRQWH